MNSSAAIWIENGPVRWGGSAKDAFCVAPDGVRAIEAVTIDKLLDDHGLPRAGFVKMDVEGGEWPLLNTPGFLNRIDSIVIEVHNPEWMAPLARILEDNGLTPAISSVDPTRRTGVRHTVPA